MSKSNETTPNVPTLRFAEYTDEWHKYALSDFVTRIMRRNKNNESSLPLTISAQYGLVDQITFFNKTVASVDLSGYYLLYNGDFAYNKSYSNDYAWGAVKRLDKYEKGCLSSLYFVFRPTDKVDSDYLTHYFETSKWHKGISDIAGEGARNHGLLNMAVDDYFATKHYLPSLSEQKKIACFLNLITKRIEIQNKIISKYETLIKGISCDYFSKQPNHIETLKDLIIKGKAGGTPSSTVAEYYNGDIPFLSISDITKQGKYVEFTEKHISENGLANSSAWIVPSNSLILSMYASVGLVCINKVPLATSQAMFSMVLKDCNMLDYIYYYLNFFRETQIHRLLETGTQSNINADTVRDIEIPFYSNILVFVKTLQANERKVETPICHYDKLGIKHPAKSAIPELWCSDTIKNILSNPHYTGCTVNFRTTKKSYKNKKKLWNDPSKWVIFEGTQEAIVDKQTYETVQKIREGRRRPTPMGEMNVFSGMVYCADCGKKMYLCRCSTMKQKEYFNCSSYRKQKKSTCSSHQITVEAIEEIVLSYLKRVSDFVIDHEKEFIDVAIEHSRMLSKKEIAKKAKQVSEAENRINTLNKVIQSLYEDKVLGKISEERFILMTEAYEQEQITLKETIANSKCEIERYDEINDNINNFVSVVVKTGRINKLTPEIVRLLIDKIIVSEKVKTESGYKRTVTIFLTHVGEIELP